MAADFPAGTSPATTVPAAALPHGLVWSSTEDPRATAVRRLSPPWCILGRRRDIAGWLPQFARYCVSEAKEEALRPLMRPRQRRSYLKPTACTWR